MKTTVSKVLREVQQLESLPRSSQRVLQELSRRDATSRSVARLLEEDPPLAARLLRVANSGLYAARSKTSTVAQAIARLGLRETQRLVAAGTLAKIFPSHAAAASTAAALYVHALASAAAVEILGRHVGAECRGAMQAGECFTVALLHDIGILVFCCYAPDTYAALVARTLSDTVSLCDLETDEFGFSHTDLGADLLERWGLPRMHADAARWHHAPARAPVHARQLAAFMHLLDHVVNVTTVDPRLGGLTLAADLEALNTVGIASRAMHDVLAQTQPAAARARELAAALGVDVSPN